MRALRRHTRHDQSFNFLVSLLYAQAFQALYYSADQIHHGALPCHVHFVLDEFAAMPLPGFTRELATMRSRNISASTIIQNMAQIKELLRIVGRQFRAIVTQFCT